MRKIIFRGYNQEAGWVYGSLLTDPCRVEILDCDYDGVPIEVAPSTIGQFTGLTDKNGTEIYEGDILNNYDEPNPLVVVWEECFARFVLYTLEGDFECDFCSLEIRLGVAVDAEIIGNIHDDEIKE